MSDDEKLSFSVDLLLSEPIDFTTDEIAEAVNADFPAFQIDGSLLKDMHFSTSDVVTGMMTPKDKENGELISLFSLGFVDEEFKGRDHTETGWLSYPHSQQALDAIKAHKSYLNVSCTPTDDSLAARFRAARMMTIVSSVFAALPVTLGVYVVGTGRVVPGKEWVEAAQMATRGEWPLHQWIGYRSAWNLADPADSRSTVGYTSGLKSFIDAEVHLQPAPFEPSDGLMALVYATYVLLVSGNPVYDGDTMGTDKDDKSYRFRIQKADYETPHDIYHLFHKDSPVDHVDMFGPTENQPPPPGFDNTMQPKPNFMRRLLGRN